MKALVLAGLTLAMILVWSGCSTKKEAKPESSTETYVGDVAPAPPADLVERDILGEEPMTAAGELPPEATTPAAPAYTPPRPTTTTGTGYVSPLPPVSQGYPDYTTPSRSAGGARVAPGGTYIVKRGDSLWSISRRHGTTVQALAAANNLNPSAPIREGQRLVIPSGSAATSSATGTATSSERTYRVQPGDTYSRIARKFGVSTQKLMEYNNATSPMLRVGQVLRIP